VGTELRDFQPLCSIPFEAGLCARQVVYFQLLTELLAQFRLHSAFVHWAGLGEYKAKTMNSATALRSQIEAALADRIPSALTPSAKTVREVVSTGIAAIDAVLNGGLPV
jgi:hypothetical protein